MIEEIDKKIEKINKIRDFISSNKIFLKLLEKGNQYYKKENDKKLNYYNYLVLSATIWTGSENSKYQESLHDSVLLNKIKMNMVKTIDGHILEQEKELNKYLK